MLWLDSGAHGNYLTSTGSTLTRAIHPSGVQARTLRQTWPEALAGPLLPATLRTAKGEGE